MTFALVHILVFAAKYGKIFQTTFAGGACVFWMGGTAMLVLNRHRYGRLSRMPLSAAERRCLPSLSILVPACNEAATIERAMESLLALEYPNANIEIIAVNDRSTDCTGEILDRLAARHDRLTVTHISHLPAGWLGKNHALYTASQRAGGDWLLFTDADVIYRPDALAQAVGYAVKAGTDHLVVTPRIETHGFWEKLFVSYFGLMFSLKTRPWDVADPNSTAYTGFGAFNMVRAAAYRSFGGHLALPMEVADDTKLGKVVKQHGFRTELAQGEDLMSVRWVIGFRGVIDCLHKNAFAGFDFKLLVTFAAVFGIATSALYPFVFLIGPWSAAHWLAVGSILGMFGGAAAIRRVSDASPLYSLAYPLAAVILSYVILRSTLSAYRRQGIIWRGTLYPLEELKRGVV